MITPTQMRAARAMLDVSQGHVAEFLGIAANTLSKIESGQSDVSVSRNADIQRFYEREGIAFTENDGVKWNKNEIVHLEGAAGFVEFMNDVLDTVKGNQSEICISNVNEENWENNLPEKFAETYRQEISKISGLKYKIFVSEGDKFHTSETAQYKQMPKEYFYDDTCFYAYGDKLALITFKEDDVQTVILKNKKFSDSFRQMFKISWDSCEGV